MSKASTAFARVVACTCALSMMCIGIPATALAADDTGTVFTAGGITYKVTAEGEVSVGNATGELAVDHSVTGADVVIPQTVSNGQSTYTVTSIATRAFQEDKTITSITLPATVKNIGTYAFDGCGTMDDTGTTPRYSGLSTIKFSGTTQLKYISDYAFNNCYNLKTFTIPASVLSIESHAFFNCMSFDKLEFEKGTQIDSIGMCAFEISWQDGFVKPKGWADSDGWDAMGTSFVSGESSDCYVDIDFTEANEQSKVYGGLKSIVFPKSLSSIKMRAFANQRVLTSVTFESDTIEYFDSYVFAFCTSLKEIELPAVGHMLSADEGYITGLGNHLLTCCTNLETVTFNEVRSPSGRWNGLRIFDGCRKLTKVVYNYNKIIPAKDWAFGFNTQYYGFQTNDPTLYYRVGFCASRDKASAGGSDLGWAVLREGTSSSQVKASMATSDAEGSIVLRGSVPQLPSGYDAWSFVARGSSDALSARTGIDDVVFAYPVKSSDLTDGDITFSQDMSWYDGSAHKPQVEVVDAAGTVLGEADYQLGWERQNANGTWSATSDFTSQGTLRAVVTGAGAYTGTVTKEFEIAYLEEGVTFTQDGITYMVTKSQTASSSAELQVGDGESLAIDAEAQGTVSIPATVKLEGTSLEVPVTSIGAKAFGADDSAGDVCTLVTGVDIPEGITSIGELAFANMSSLANVELPASLQTIGTGAFKHCTSLAGVTFAGTELKRVGADAFSYCSRLKSIELPAITENFLGLVFQNCVMLTSVVFTGDVNGNRLSQFDGCSRLARVTYLGSYWDYSWPAGTSITAVAGDASYSVTAGAKNAVYAACLANGSKAAVPAKVNIGSTVYTVSGIAAGAFKGTKVKTLTVKSTSLSAASVKDCLKGSKVTAIKVPAKKKSSYKKAFSAKNAGKKATIK